MTNLSSPSKVRYALGAAVGLTAVSLVIQLLQKSWTVALLSVITLCAMGATYHFFKLTMAKIEVCMDVLTKAADGHLDSRIIRLNEVGFMAQLGNKINNLLDLNEAFTKEAHAAMESANKRRYFRKIIPTGLRGSFVYYAETINKSLHLMAEHDREFKDFVTTKVAVLANTVSDSAKSLNGSATDIAKLSSQTDQESGVAANSAQQASNNVQAVAAAVEEFSVATAEIAQQVNKVADISKHAVTTLSKSDAAVERLTEATTKIGGVLELINRIADQTKLLALNATIEAARAGESGKGFAVVASEVKALAEQTARATEDISSQVNEMQAISEATVSSMHDMGTAVRDISSAASTVAAAAEEQKAASGEIARNLNEAVGATQIVSESVSKAKNAAMASAHGVKQISTSSENLSALAVNLLKQIDEFLLRLGHAV